MSDDDAKAIIDFLVKSAECKKVIVRIRNKTDSVYMHEFIVIDKNGFASNIYTSNYKSNKISFFFVSSNLKKIEKPYLWLLKKILKESQNGYSVFFGWYFPEILLAPHMTLEKIKIKMDLSC